MNKSKLQKDDMRLIRKFLEWYEANREPKEDDLFDWYGKFYQLDDNVKVTENNGREYIRKTLMYSFQKTDSLTGYRMTIEYRDDIFYNVYYSCASFSDDIYEYWRYRKSTRKAFIRNFLSPHNEVRAAYYDWLENNKEDIFEGIKKELDEYCMESINERIEGLKSRWFGGGMGRSTELKKIIHNLLSGLSFNFIRRCIDSFDEVMGWNILDKERKDQYYIFRHPNSYERNGYNESYFISEYGILLSDFLFKEWLKLHEHKFHSKNILDEYRLSDYYRPESMNYFHTQDGITRRDGPKKKCYICGNWFDDGLGTKICNYKENGWCHNPISEDESFCEEHKK